MSEELNECPFCGGPAEMHEWHEVDASRWAAHIRCSNCGAEGPTRYADNHMGCFDAVNDLHKTRASEDWNRRALLSTLNGGAKMLTDEQIIAPAEQEFREGVFHNGPSRYIAFARAILAASAAASPVSGAARDVLAERQRQIEEEGHSTEDDDIHNDQGQMSYAAAGLAATASDAATDIECGLTGGLTYADECIGTPEPWPQGWLYKSATPRRNLVKAGALILAEIERIDRASQRCRACNGNDGDMPCAYPEGHPNCLRIDRAGGAS